MRSRLPEGFKEIPGQDLGEKYPHKDLTERIIGCAIKVHRALRAGFVEGIYENALAHELTLAGMNVARQVKYPVYYETKLVGEHRADMVVQDAVVIELKAVTELVPQHVAQIMSTLMAAKKEVGLLLNFHESQLVDGLRRVVLQRKLEQNL